VKNLIPIWIVQISTIWWLTDWGVDWQKNCFVKKRKQLLHGSLVANGEKLAIVFWFLAARAFANHELLMIFDLSSGPCRHFQDSSRDSRQSRAELVRKASVPAPNNHGIGDVEDRQGLSDRSAQLSVQCSRRYPRCPRYKDHCSGNSPRRLPQVVVRILESIAMRKRAQAAEPSQSPPPPHWDKTFPPNSPWGFVRQCLIC
jgi:hypothetical protein